MFCRHAQSCAARRHFYTLPRSWKSPPRRRAVEQSFGVGKGFRWTTRPGRPASAPCLTGSPGSNKGPRRGRRSPYRHPRQGRQDGGGGQGGLDVSGPTYAALDLGTNNCRLLVARADPRRLPGDRRVLAHHPARRRHHQLRPPERARDPARGRRLARLPRQDAQPRRHPLAPDRDRGLPLGRQRPRFPASASATRSASNWRSSIARPRRGSPPPAARRWSIRRPRA